MNVVNINQNNLDNKYNVEILGQVFTPFNIIDKLISLSSNINKKRHADSQSPIKILEPSCGNGNFYKRLKDLDLNVVGVEIDSNICPSGAINIDFFDYSIENKFDLIIGNPPYVKYKNINEKSKESLKEYIKKTNSNIFDERINLYVYFMEKCLHHLKNRGELIFIVPRDFMKASSSVLFNQFLYEQGTITDWIDLGDKKIFPGFSPNCIIFRFEKNNFTRKTKIENEDFVFNVKNGQIFFSQQNYPLPLSNLFFVKVGAASGADNLFIHENGNVDFVYSKTRTTNKTRKMFYEIENNELLIHKNALLKRKIKNFNNNNWYHWGRKYLESDLPRIYVNIRTRQKNPFFIHDCKAFDGNILALFPKIENFNHFDMTVLQEICVELNSINWEELGFLCNNRYLFSQNSLENSYLPSNFLKYYKNK